MVFIHWEKSKGKGNKELQVYQLTSQFAQAIVQEEEPKQSLEVSLSWESKDQSSWRPKWLQFVKQIPERREAERERERKP